MAGIAQPITERRRRSHRKAWIAIALAVLLAVGSGVAWNNGLRDQLVPRNFGVVEDGKLYRSGQISARLIESTLRDHHIQVIVALAAGGMKPADNATEQRAATELGIDRQLFPLSGDGTGDPNVYAGAIAAIDRAVRVGKPVLVHCVAGAQRTGGVIAAYRLLIEKRPAAEAYAEMRRFGHDPHDNPHLVEYLNSHMGEIAHVLVSAGAIEQLPDPIPVLQP
jgi:protein tyrosine/serine phosphatase